MNETLLFPPIESELAALCEQCQKPFTPRNGSGGKAQRFCSRECRATFHQRLKRDAPTSPPTSQPTSIEAPKTAPTDEPLRDEFSWGEDKLIVVPSQPAIAVYLNPRGDIVIRQESQYDDEDRWVYIAPANLMLVIDRLCDLAGIGSAGRSD